MACFDNLNVCDYAEEIYTSMLQKEDVQTPTIHQNFSTLNEKTIVCREILIDWLIQVVGFSGMSQDVLALTIHIIDTALPRMASDLSLLQLLGVAAFRLATKYEARITLSLAELVQLTGSCFDKSQILAMESALLKLLDYNLTTVLPSHFLSRLVALTSPSQKTKTVASLILESALLSGCYTNYLPSCLATCSLTLAHLILKTSNSDWQLKLQQQSGYTLAYMTDCLNELCINSLDQLVQEDLKAISVKYGLRDSKSTGCSFAKDIQDGLMDVIQELQL